MASAIQILSPYLPKDMRVWECTHGAMNYVDDLELEGYSVVRDSDNYYAWDSPLSWILQHEWDCIVARTSYNIKYAFLRHCYRLGRPFALLMSIDTLGTKQGQKLFAQYGLNMLLLGGGGNAWFTWKLDIDKAVVFADKRPVNQPYLLKVGEDGKEKEVW